MRSLPAVLGLLYVLLSSAAAADTRTFLIASSPDGYGVDQCLATGASCGQAIANSYCGAQGYAQAAAFRKADASEITGAVTVATESGWRSASQAFVAIDCTR